MFPVPPTPLGMTKTRPVHPLNSYYICNWQKHSKSKISAQTFPFTLYKSQKLFTGLKLAQENDKSSPPPNRSRDPYP